MARHAPFFAAALLAALSLSTLRPGEAGATGMQGHVYMAQCAAENVTDARLRAIFDAFPKHVANGAFLVDSGYIMPDHDQGEIPHWEAFIEAYLQLIRERYEAPYDSPEAAAHVSLLMGMAAHGITDSTFDTLIYARAEQVEPEPMDSFDTAMDIFLVHDMPRYFIPEIVADPQTLSDAFTAVEHPISPEDVTTAMSTARSGIAAVTTLLEAGADEYGLKYPWGRAHFLDAKTPGSYSFGAGVVMGYYRELLRRLDGDTSADQIVIGTYPSDAYPLVTLDATRPDGKVILFFGHGLDRGSINDDVVTVLGPDGMAVPATVEVFRGDEWANVLLVKPEQSWQAGAKYEVVLSPTVQTLYGTSPTDDFVFSFTTCASPDENGDCPPAAAPGPFVACPKTEAQYAMPRGEGGGGSGGGGGAGGAGGGGAAGAGAAGGAGGGQGSGDTEGGGCECGLSTRDGEVPGALALLGFGAAALRRRRRRP